MAVGDYEIQVEQPGFQAVRVTGIHVDINQVVRNDVTLKIGNVVESVTVEATAAAIKTDDATVSEVISTRAGCGAAAELPRPDATCASRRQAFCRAAAPQRACRPARISSAPARARSPDEHDAGRHQHHEQPDHHHAHAADG